MNKINNPKLISELEGLPIEELENYAIEVDMERYVALDSLDEFEYNKYKKIVIINCIGQGYTLKDSVYIPFHSIWAKLNYGKGEIERYLEGFNISKKDKLLIICAEGLHSSQIISYFLFKKGYDAYHSGLNTIHNESFIEFSTTKNFNKENSIILGLLDYDINEKYYFFIFNIQEHRNIERFSSLFEDGKIKKNVYGIRGTIQSERNMKEEHPEIRIVDIKKIDLKKSKFICLTPLHCLLTKHKIVELNLGINKIYLPEPIEDFYD